MPRSSSSSSQTLVVLLLLLVSALICANGVEIEEEESLQWAATYCRRTRYCFSSNNCCSKTPRVFTIHGLWPEYNDGSWPSCCSGHAFHPKESDENGDQSALCSYASWLENHPSALDNFEELMSIAKGKEIVVFLDYDGTLSPIVDDPDQAYMSDAMRAAVHEVASCFPTAIVSGRRRDKVHEFVKLRNVYYAGSHGMDISTPLGSSKNEDQKYQTKVIDEKGNQSVNFLPAKEYLPTIQEIIEVLKDNITRIKGSTLEDNMYCISVHYRRVKNEEDVVALKEIVEYVMKDYPKFQISGGRKVIEIRPKINWDKGHALSYLLKALGFDNNDVLPMYLGDDRTDEDAFKVIRHIIGQGFPIIVSSIAKETMASYSLRDPADAMTFLIRLAKWKKTCEVN